MFKKITQVSLMLVLCVIGIALSQNTYSISSTENEEISSVEELLDMRTESKKVYSLGNDTHRFEFYTNPIYYFDAYENGYVEFDQGLSYDLKTTKYTTSNSNYRVELPTTSSVDNMVRVNYYDLYSIDIDYFDDKSMDESYISEENNVYATYKNNLDGQLRFIPQNSNLNATYLFTSPKSSRQVNFTNIYASNAYLYQVIIPAVIYTIKHQPSYNARVLSSINESISENEYRIALRIGNVDEISTSFYTIPSNWGPYTKYDDFHFMIQLDDGSWSHKIGNLPSLHLSSLINPSEIDWDAPYTDYSTGEYFPNHYNSYTIYFAITHTKPIGWGY